MGPEATIAYEVATAADAAWQAELVKAFGRDACNRRYDMDQSKHPMACREAYAKWGAAMNAWKVASFYDGVAGRSPIP